MFDSKVNARRNHTPWARISLAAIMKDLADAAPDLPGAQEVKFSVEYRHDVATRYWWTLSWTDEKGQPHSVSAQDPDLCLWRSAEVAIQVSEGAPGEAAPGRTEEKA